MQAWWTEAMLGQFADQQMVSAVIEGYHHISLQALPGTCVRQWCRAQEPRLITLVILQPWALALSTA